MRPVDKQIKIDELIKIREKLTMELQATVDLLSERYKRLVDLDLDLYSTLINPDCLYGDSPLGRGFTNEWLKQYMIKKDLDFVGYFLDGKINIKTFVQRASESSKWAMRFAHEGKPEKTGLQAIID